jgi:hypothetical protein
MNCRVALRQRLQDLGARGEVGIEGALGHVGRGDDVADGGGFHALRQEQRLRGVHQFFLAGFSGFGAGLATAGVCMVGGIRVRRPPF